MKVFLAGATEASAAVLSRSSWTRVMKWLGDEVLGQRRRAVTLGGTSSSRGRNADKVWVTRIVRGRWEVTRCIKIVPALVIAGAVLS